jgi:hypothetical protein
MGRIPLRSAAPAILGLCGLLCAAQPAQTAEQFYKGRTLRRYNSLVAAPRGFRRSSIVALSHFRTENRTPPPPPRGRAFS